MFSRFTYKLIFLALIVLSQITYAKIIYVDIASASSTKNGTSWSTAYSDLQMALDSISSGDTIRVAEGKYYPTSDHTGSTSASRDFCFHIANKDFILSGGWKASTGLQNGDTTFLSGDIGTVGLATDNAYHIFIAANLTSNTVINDIAFVDAYANGGYTDITYASKSFGRNYGGGMNLVASSPQLINITYKYNFATQSGGGIFFTDSCSPKVIGCTFLENKSHYGGAIDNLLYVKLFVSNCIFYKNNATNLGGAISNNLYNDLTVENCAFIINKGNWGGGAIFNNSSLIEVSSSSFVKNETSSSGGGGAMFVQSSRPVVYNNLFYKNTKSGIIDIFSFWTSDTLNPSSTNNAADTQFLAFPNSIYSFAGK